MFATIRALERGLIVQWSGLIADIPGGWGLCDGSRGTPNLLDSFIVCAGNTYVVAATGGAVNHVHGQTIDSHGHTIAGGSSIASGSGYSADSGGPMGQSDVDSANGLPPYYALAYIMKL